MKFLKIFFFLSFVFFLACDSPVEEVKDDGASDIDIQVVSKAGSDLIGKSGDVLQMTAQSTILLNKQPAKEKDLPIHYKWAVASPQNGGLVIQTDSEPNEKTAVFTLPTVSQSTVFVVFLTTYYDKKKVDTDSVKITVNPVVSNNSPPVANAGTDRAVISGDTVNLAGSYTDADIQSNTNAAEIISTRWFSVQGLLIQNSNFPRAILVAPNVTKSTTYTFNFEVKDRAGAIGTDSVLITVNPPAQPTVLPLTANAGPSLTAESGERVNLTGSGSPGTIVGYQWTAPTSSGITITDANQPNAELRAPTVSSQTSYIITLEVTDSKGQTATDTMHLTVNPPSGSNQPPTANAGSDITTTAGKIVSLDGSGSSDSDGQIVSYEWSQISGSNINLLRYDKVDAGFVAPSKATEANYEFRLKVTDDSGAIAEDDVKVTVEASGGGNTNSPNLPPDVSLVITPQKSYHRVGDLLTLTANALDKDGSIVSAEFYDGNTSLGTDTAIPFEYIWTAAGVGNHDFKVVVTDNSGATTTSSVVSTNVINSSSKGQSGDFTVSVVKNDSGWERFEVTVTYNGNADLDINNASLVYKLPNGNKTHQMKPRSFSGISWVSGNDWETTEVNSGNDVEFQRKIKFTQSWMDSTVSKGDSFKVLIADFSPSLSASEAQQIFDNYLNNKVFFYLENDIPFDYAELKVTAPTKPAGIVKDEVEVFVKNNSTGKVIAQKLAWGSDYRNVHLTSGTEYSVWAEIFQETVNSSKKGFSPSYTADAPFLFRGTKNSPTEVSFTYTSSDVQSSQITLMFAGIPSDAGISVRFQNLLSSSSDYTLTKVRANTDQRFQLDQGTYKLRVNDIRGSDGKYYIADVGSEVEVTGDQTIVINFKGHDFGPVPGLPSHLAMGTITSASSVINPGLSSAKIEAIFKYAGPGGNGDRGAIIDPIFTRNTIAQARAIETATRKVIPFMVVYTAEASGGGWGEPDIVDFENLKKHNINLIRIVRELQKNKDIDHPKPGGIILNADFLGVLQQGDALNPTNGLWRGGKWYGTLLDHATGATLPADPNGRIVEVNRSLKEAMEYVKNNDGGETIALPDFEDNLFGYLQMQNYIIRAYGPDVIFGWQENLWSVGSADWVHARYDSSDALKSQISSQVSDFLLNKSKVYTGLWKPDFITFDKYERDGFGPGGARDYAYNHNDWWNYLEYAKHIGEDLDLPIVLWQIPGGHMPFEGDNHGPYNYLEHGASPAQYFFGEPRLKVTSSISDPISLLEDDFEAIILGGGVQSRIDSIYHKRRTVGEYLREPDHQTKSFYNWQASQLQRIADYGVVAILWGGGATTSVVPLDSNTGDDGGWLKAKINDYYDNGRITLPARSSNVSSSTASNGNNPPLVNAGSDLSANPGATVQLTGTATDPDSNGSISQTAWSGPPSFVFADPYSLNTSFTVPNLPSGSTHTLTLTATDNLNASSSDRITITITGTAAVSTGNSPVVSAGTDQTVNSGDTVILGGSATDSDGTIVSHQWAFVSSVGVSISNEDKATASFVAPQVNALTTYRVSYTATDDDGNAVSDTTSIKVLPPNSSTNTAPSVSVGSDKVVDSGDTVKLSANATDPQGNSTIIAYQWRILTPNSGISLSGADTKDALFIAPSITGSSAQDIEIECLVRDQGGLESTDSLIVRIQPEKAAQANLVLSETSITGEVGDTKTFTVSGGSGNGQIQLSNSNSSAVRASLSGDTVTLNLNAKGSSILTLKKFGDNQYSDGTPATVSVSVSEPASVGNTGQEDFLSTSVKTGWSISLNIENNKGVDVNIRNARIIFSSPENLTNFDVQNNGYVSSIAIKDLSSDQQADGTYHISFTIDMPEESWVDPMLGDGEIITIKLWPNDSDVSKYRVVSINLGDNSAATGSVVASINDGYPYSHLDDPIDLTVKDWGVCLQMGNITDQTINDSQAQDLAESGVRAIFKYEGDGAGDRGKIIDASVTQSTIDQIAQIQAKQSSPVNIVPVMVIYTADGSTGGVGEIDIKEEDNLEKHYINLIRTVRKLQAYGKGSIIVNPDLLGEWLLSTYKNSNDFVAQYGDEGSYKTIPIRQNLQDAINYIRTQDSGSNVSIPADIDDNILGYIQSINFLIRSYGPDITFGWQQNLWAIGSANWVHKNDYIGQQDFWNQVSKPAVKFMDKIGIFSGNYKPDFLVFDKYEYDGFGGGKANYAFNSLTWDNYLLFVKQMTDFFQVPAMLWQIPGGHMAVVGENISSEWIARHSASGGPYFMGDPRIGTDLSKVQEPVKDIALSRSVYGADNVGEFLALDPGFDWGKNRLRKAAYSNVFSILWGGGNTAGIVRQILNTSRDDNGWLKGRVAKYYNDGCMKIHGANTSGSASTGGTSVSENPALNAVLESSTVSSGIDNNVLLYETPELTQVPSTIYRWKDFLQGVKLMHNIGIAGNTLWLGDATASDSSAVQQKNAKYGLVSLAAFLAQSMQETIRYNACDENNWDNQTYGNYTIEAACGQLGQDYAAYGNGKSISCPEDPKMEVYARSNAGWYGAPPPLFATPDKVLRNAGLQNSIWTHSSPHCNGAPAAQPGFTLSADPPYARPECEVYKGQKGGSFSPGVLTQTLSVEGCGWWGRGVIQTTGRENFGELNHYLGRSHLADDDQLKATNPAPTNPIYPGIDFCSNPEVICSSKKNPELKWIAGLFYWMSSVQNKPFTNWEYKTKLKEYVDGGLNGRAFIDSVSSIVNRGCPNPSGCATGAPHALAERAAFFEDILIEFGIK